MAMVSQSKLSSVLSLLAEALFLLANDWRPLLPVLLLHLLSSCLVSLSNHLILSPILADFSSRFASQTIPGGPNPDLSLLMSSMRKPIREIAVIEAFILVLAFVFSSLITMAIVHLLSAAYSSKPLKPQDLPSLIRRTWKGPFLTQLCAAVLNLSGAFLIVSSICVVMFVAIGSSGFTIGGAFISIILILSYLFLSLISCMAVVVSVVEEGCYGLAAMARSLELTDGRKRIGVLSMLAVSVMYWIVSLVYGFSAIYASAPVFVRLVIEFAYLVACVMMNAYVLSVVTVFYYECKSHGGALLAMEERLAYSGLSKEDAAIP